MSLVKLNITRGVTGTLPTSNYVQGGITGIDTWGLSSTQTHSSGGVLIGSGWARRTTHNSSNLGTAMTQSSGVFTFPSTGHWLIIARFYFDGNSDTHYRGVIMRNGSGTTIQSSYGHSGGSNPNWHHDAVAVQFNMDVTDTTAGGNKIDFITNSGGSLTIAGGSNGESYVSFIRLGDT